MNVLLLQARIISEKYYMPPNLALGRLSTYHKLKGDTITFRMLDKKDYDFNNHTFVTSADGYDKVYISQVFTYTPIRVFDTNGRDVVIGGIGSNRPDAMLPPEIECLPIDYSIFASHWDGWSFGHITKGCIRNCEFCDVRRSEGTIHFNRSIDDIIQDRDHGCDDFKLVLMDSNLFSYRKHLEILDEIIDRDLTACFFSGNDVRLMTDDIAKRLQIMKARAFVSFADEPIKYDRPIKHNFSFDNTADQYLIEEGISKLIEYIDPSKISLFLYYNERHNHVRDLLHRIDFCYKWGMTSFPSPTIRFKYPRIINEHKVAFVNFMDDPFGVYLTDHHTSDFTNLLKFVLDYADGKTFDLILDGHLRWKSPSIIGEWAELIKYPNREIYLSQLNL